MLTGTKGTATLIVGTGVDAAANATESSADSTAALVTCPNGDETCPNGDETAKSEPMVADSVGAAIEEGTCSTTTGSMTVGGTKEVVMEPKPKEPTIDNPAGISPMPGNWSAVPVAPTPVVCPVRTMPSARTPP